MTRLMVDATHDGVPYIPQVGMVAGYVTGSPDIAWTPSDWAHFPGKVLVTIDQGYTGAPRYDANVMDIETGAWSVGHVTDWMNHATQARPTVYVNRGNEQAACAAALLSPRFKGDVWLAYPGWDESMPLPMLPNGCNYVAVQNTYSLHYDESVVFDNDWPAAPVVVPPVTNWTEAMMQQLPLTGPGATGTFVKRIQGLTTANGHPTVIDGDFGPKTTAAVEACQHAAGIPVDGWVGQQTWPALL